MAGFKAWCKNLKIYWIPMALQSDCSCKRNWSKKIYYCFSKAFTSFLCQFLPKKSPLLPENWFSVRTKTKSSILRNRKASFGQETKPHAQQSVLKTRKTKDTNTHTQYFSTTHIHTTTCQKIKAVHSQPQSRSLEFQIKFDNA